MNREDITIKNRIPGAAPGYTTVNATIAGGENGEYLIADQLVGTPDELDEILKQSSERQDTRAATKDAPDTSDATRSGKHQNTRSDTKGNKK